MVCWKREKKILKVNDKLDSELSTDHVSVISQWGKKWLERGQISKDMAEFVDGFIQMDIYSKPIDNHLFVA